MQKILIRKKRLIAVLMLIFTTLGLVGCGKAGKTFPAPEGRFDCSLYEKEEKGLQPIDKEDIYEHLTFNPDGSGLWESGFDSEFTWKIKGEKIILIEDLGENKNIFEGKWDGEKITLDVVGYDCIFEKEEPSSKEDLGSSDLTSSDISWEAEPAGSIQIPSKWYGVAIFKNCVGFDFDKVEYDVWGFMEEDSDKRASFQLFLDPEASSYPILSMYIDQEEGAWLTPVIGENDSWLLVDPACGNQDTLDEEDYWTILAPYNEGAIDIVYDYHDSENAQYANGRLFVRELGTPWNEESDPLPPGYDDYKKEFSQTLSPR